MSRFKLAILLLIFFLAGCKEESVLTGLDQNQANEVLSLLQKNNIPATKKNMGKTGFSIDVSSQDFPLAVDLIHDNSLPSGKLIEVAEMFPTDSLISSPRAEVARIYSAIEQRLEQTLRHIDAVVIARVHVSYDMSNTDAEKNKKPLRVSALLKVNDTLENESGLIADAKKIIVNSFNNIEYESITVVLTYMNDVQLKQPTVSEKGSVQILVILLVCMLGFILLSYFLFQDKKALLRTLRRNTNEDNKSS